MAMNKKRFFILTALALLPACLLSCHNKAHSQAAKAPQSDLTEITIADFDNENWGNDRISDEIANRFNVKIIPQPYTNSNRVTMVEFWSNQNKLPDMFFLDGPEDSSTYYRYVQNKALREIPISSLMSRPNIKNLLDNNPVYKDYLINNKLYAIPHTFWMTPQEDFKGQVAWVRKDWREKLQIPKPETLQQWTAMLDAFANNDPDGNGIKDTYGISYMDQPVPNFIYWANQAFVEEWIYEDGKWIHGALSKNAVKAVEYCRSLYQKGIIDPTFIAQRELKKVLDTFIQGNTGVIAYGSMPDEVEEVYVYFQKANPTLNAFDCIEFLPFPKGSDGKIRNGAAYNCFYALGLDANVSDEKLNKILDIIEWTLSPEGERMMLYGFEGEDYTMVDNKPINMLGKDKDGTTRTAKDKYPTAMLGYYFNHKSTQRMQGTLTNEPYLSISREICEFYKDKGIEKEINLEANKWQSSKKEQINFTKAFQAIANQLILTSEDINVKAELDNYWNKFDQTHQIYALFDELTEYMKLK